MLPSGSMILYCFSFNVLLYIILTCTSLAGSSVLKTICGVSGFTVSHLIWMSSTISWISPSMTYTVPCQFTVFPVSSTICIFTFPCSSNSLSLYSGFTSNIPASLYFVHSPSSLILYSLPVEPSG